MTVPDWWAATLLALAAYRVFRIVGEDKITERPRNAILDRIEARRGSGAYWAEFVTCPWCAGFWIVGVALLVYYTAFEELHGWDVAIGFLVTWFALSAVVGLLASVQALVDRFNG